MPDTDFNVRYTNRDIMEKLNKQDATLDDIRLHVQLTNGRVSTLETKSLGVWISNNPFKFAMMFLSFFAVFLPEIREPLLLLMKRIF